MQISNQPNIYKKMSRFGFGIRKHNRNGRRGGHKRHNPNAKVKSVVTGNVTGKSINHNFTDVYFVIDVSGSMGGVPLRKANESIKNIAAKLHDKDRISVVTFDGATFFKLKPRPVGQVLRQQELEKIFERIYAGNCTALWDAIYNVVTQIRNKNNNTKIIVLSDKEDNSSTHTLADVTNLLGQYPKVEMNILKINHHEFDATMYQQLCGNTGTVLTANMNNFDTQMQTLFA